MAVSIRNAFSVDLARTLLEEVQFQRANLYYFLGTVKPWADEEAPPTITPCDICERFYRSEIAFVKKILPGDVSLVITRHDWISGTVYDQWDHTKDNRNSKFYVINSTENTVYKCISNNEGAESTVVPSGKSFYTFQTEDGYLWKYMYTIPTFKVDRFLNSLYIPVQTALGDSLYSKGEIESVSIVSEGAGYLYDPLTYITVNNTGKTTGSGATVSLTVDAGGTITGVTVDNGGTGYTKGARIVITGNGQGAVLTPVISGGVITNVTIVSGGYGYLGPLSASVVVGGASILPILDGSGSIVDLKITDPGIGYSAAPTLTVVSSTSAGTGKYVGNSTALVSCVVDSGMVVQANIIDPGIQYPVDTSTTIQIDGDGEGAVVRPIVVGGRIVGTVVVSPGSGYSYANVSVLTTNEITTEARLLANISSSDFVSDQSIVEQVAIKGAIHTIKVTNGGANYTLSTIVTITGNGTGCVATPVISGGVIQKIVVSNPGSGYTYASVTITDPGRIDSYVPPSDAASAYAILPPVNGHGWNAVEELYATTFSVSTTLGDNLSSTLFENDYRSFGIIKDPRFASDGNLYRNDNEFVVYNVSMQSVDGLNLDDVLTINSNRFRVFGIKTTAGVNTVELIPLDSPTASPIGTAILGEASFSVTGVLSFPLFDKYSGSVLYISTEEPFSFDQEQSISIKTFISF